MCLRDARTQPRTCVFKSTLIGRCDEMISRENNNNEWMNSNQNQKLFSTFIWIFTHSREQLRPKYFPVYRQRATDRRQTNFNSILMGEAVRPNENYTIFFNKIFNMHRCRCCRRHRNQAEERIRTEWMNETFWVCVCVYGTCNADCGNITYASSNKSYHRILTKMHTQDPNHSTEATETHTHKHTILTANFCAKLFAHLNLQIRL